MWGSLTLLPKRYRCCVGKLWNIHQRPVHYVLRGTAVGFTSHKLQIFVDDCLKGKTTTNENIKNWGKKAHYSSAERIFVKQTTLRKTPTLPSANTKTVQNRTHVHRCTDDLLRDYEQVGRELVRAHVQRHQRAEDLDHCFVIELQCWHDVEVTQEALRDRVARATWRTHGRHNEHVDQRDLRCVFQVVPAMQTITWGYIRNSN